MTQLVLILQNYVITVLIIHHKFQDSSVAAQARATDRIFEILIVGAKPRHSGQAAGANQ